MRIKRLLRTVLPVLMSFMFLVGSAPYAGAAPPATTTIRVGLRYTSNGSDVSSAWLTNFVGHGFYFGYFDQYRKATV